MYNFSTINNCNYPWFDTLFSQSLPHFDDGNQNWASMGLSIEDSYETKKEVVLTKINNILQPGGVGIYISENGLTPLRLFVGGVQERNNKNYLFFIYDLIGANSEGSKSWLYSTEFAEAFKSFTKSAYPIEGHIARLYKQRHHYLYVMQRSSEMYNIEEVTESELLDASPGCTDIILTYK